MGNDLAHSHSPDGPAIESAGFSLIETIVATALIATAVVSLAQLFGVAARSNIGSRNTTYAAVLAAQKLEELRALTWGFDVQGQPVSDFDADTAAVPESLSGGTGLTAAPADALRENTAGWVDHVDRYGRKLGGGKAPPRNAAYTRRWAVQPLPENPNTLILQVLVTRLRNRGPAEDGPVRRLPEEARLITAKTRKAQ